MDYFFSIFYILSIMILMGCNRMEITPETINSEKKYGYYNEVVNISGGRVRSATVVIDTDFPEDMNLNIHPVGDLASPYNSFSIQGKPKYSGHFSITISGDTYRGSGGGGEFEKNMN